MSARHSTALAVAIAAGLALGGCRSVDSSFKTVTFEGTAQEKAFDVCSQVVAAHYYGTTIRTDKLAGRIETDPVEEPAPGKSLRQQCYVQVQPLADGKLEVAVFARMQRLVVETGSDPPIRWQDVGSDVQVEGILLDEISGRILALDTEAKVVATTLPKVARPR